jgi:hypothetical protein
MNVGCKAAWLKQPKLSEQKDLKQWYEKMGFVEQETKTFSHLL